MFRGTREGQRRSGTRYDAAMGVPVFGVTTKGRAAGVRVLATRPVRVGYLEDGSWETQPTLFGVNSELYRETQALSPTL